MKRWNHKIWNTIAVSAVLAVGILNGCGSTAPNVNAEFFEIQQAFAEDMSKEDVLSSDSMSGEALAFSHEIQTETASENTSDMNVISVEKDAVEKTDRKSVV